MAIAVLALVACSLAACRRAAPSPAYRPAVAKPLVAPSLERRPPAEEESFVGVVIAPETVDVTSQLEARITGIEVRPGDHVERGAILANLDTRAARHELAIADADLWAARSERQRNRLELAQAGERLARRQTVVELPSGPVVGTASAEEVSSSTYQQKIAAVHVAAADAAVAAKEAHSRQLRALLAEGAVRAPFDGTVAARYADVGAMIHKGTSIVRLIEDGELRVRFAIPEERANVLAVADPVTIIAGERRLSGTVEKIAPEIDTASGMVFAEASIAVPPADRGRVRSGQVARVRAPRTATARR